MQERPQVRFYANIDALKTKPAKVWGEEPENVLQLSGSLDAAARRFLAEMMRTPYVLITVEATQGALGGDSAPA